MSGQFPVSSWVEQAGDKKYFHIALVTYNSHSSCNHIHHPLKENAIKNIRELYVIWLPCVIHPKALVLQDECCGENYWSFLDFTRNYERTSGIFVSWTRKISSGSVFFKNTTQWLPWWWISNRMLTSCKLQPPYAPVIVTTASHPATYGACEW